MIVKDQKILTTTAIYTDLLKEAPTTLHKYYVVLECCYYLSDTLYNLIEVRHYDREATMLLMHHLICFIGFYVTISFKMYNYCVGTLALFDFSEIIFEYSKIFYYRKKVAISNIMFSIFAAYVYARLYVYPRYFIVPWINGEFKEALGYWPFSRFMTWFMPFTQSCMVAMHVVWGFFILKILYVMFFKKKNVGTESFEQEQ
jgi:hypothetical protein